MVSLDIPLISNLDTWINISLFKLYQENLSKKIAEKLVLKYLQRYKLEKIAYKRSADLTNKEQFCVMLLRATVVNDAVIAIDRPFNMLPDLKDIYFIDNTLKAIDDLFKECHIFDYIWYKERYIAINA